MNQFTENKELSQENPLRVRNGNPLQYSTLENSMSRGSLWSTVPRVTDNWTLLNVHTHTHTHKELSTTGNKKSGNSKTLRKYTC